MLTEILFVSSDEDFLAAQQEFFASQPGYTVTGQAKNGVEALEKIRALSPDVIVLDMLLPEKDGISVLAGINKGSEKIIAVSSIAEESFASIALSSGADYYLVKPVRPDELLLKIESVLRFSRKTAAGAATDRKISDIFMTVGIPAHIKGYYFLREAIKMAIDCPDIINSITKRLYPDVARRFDTSPSKVERAIRHAIEVAWNKGKIENINSLFGIKIYSSTEKPTNGEFIALVADKMLLERNI